MQKEIDLSQLSQPRNLAYKYVSGTRESENHSAPHRPVS